MQSSCTQPGTHRGSLGVWETRQALPVQCTGSYRLALACHAWASVPGACPRSCPACCHRPWASAVIVREVPCDRQTSSRGCWGQGHGDTDHGLARAMEDAATRAEHSCSSTAKGAISSVPSAGSAGTVSLALLLPALCWQYWHCQPGSPAPCPLLAVPAWSTWLSCKTTVTGLGVKGFSSGKSVVCRRCHGADLPELSARDLPLHQGQVLSGKPWQQKWLPWASQRDASQNLCLETGL